MEVCFQRTARLFAISIATLVLSQVTIAAPALSQVTCPAAADGEHIVIDFNAGTCSKVAGPLGNVQVGQVGIGTYDFDPTQFRFIGNNVASALSTCLYTKNGVGPNGCHSVGVNGDTSTNYQGPWVISWTYLDGSTENFTFTVAADRSFGSFTLTGGPFAPSTANTPSRNQRTANRSAAAAFGAASNRTQQFVTRTQTLDRLINVCHPSRDSDNCRTESTPGSNQLAAAFSDTAKSPGKFAWHSKTLINHFRDKQLTKKREKEKRAKLGLGKLGVTADATRPPAAQASEWDLWSAGGLTKIDSSRSGNSFDGEMVFGRTGFDYLVIQNFLIGAFAGYDSADADFESFNIRLDSDAKIAGGYFGYRLPSGLAGVPVDLILDGQASHAWLDYDLRDQGVGTKGTFDAERFAGSLSLTAVVLRSLGKRGTAKMLPKLGVSYTHEQQESYTDSGGNVIGGQSIALGILSFGTSVFVPVAPGIEVFGRAEGEWDFKDVGQITTSTGGTYKPDDFGVVLGGGVRANLNANTIVRVDGAAEGLGRSDYEQYTVHGRIDYRF